MIVYSAVNNSFFLQNGVRCPFDIELKYYGRKDCACYRIDIELYPVYCFGAGFGTDLGCSYGEHCGQRPEGNCFSVLMKVETARQYPMYHDDDPRRLSPVAEDFGKI